MNISLTQSKPYNYESRHSNGYSDTVNVSAQPSFGSAKARKFLAKLASIKDMKLIKATFQDMVDAYYELGYDVVMKRGSHAVVPVTENANLPLVIPHNDKYVSPFDLKRLKFVMLGDVERALRS